MKTPAQSEHVAWKTTLVFWGLLLCSSTPKGSIVVLLGLAKVAEMVGWGKRGKARHEAYNVRAVYESVYDRIGLQVLIVMKPTYLQTNGPKHVHHFSTNLWR